MTDFIPVLVAATLILFALYVIFGGFIGGIGTTPSNVKWVSEGTIRAETGEEAIYHIPLGENIIVSYSPEDVQVSSLSGTVAKGLFYSNTIKTYFEVSDISRIKGLKVSFEISDTNSYGDIVFVLNGKEVYRDRLGIGKYEFEVSPEYIKEGNNIIEVKAGSSGWRIWAPTVYILNSNIYLKHLEENKPIFNFDINSYQLEGLDFGRIVLNDVKRKGDGNLTIKLNGQEVYSGVVNDSLMEDVYGAFESSNEIEFSTSVDTSYRIGSAEIIIFSNQIPLIKTVEFDLSEPKNILKFYVSDKDVKYVNIRIVNPYRTTNIKYLLNIGDNKVYLENGTLSVGKNTIYFLSDGNVNISDVEVE